uniref:ATP synthase subunit a n=1 Tax=Cerion uva TaxID=1108933 RepID=A0A343AZV8_9EUPU|nr:ATP synthase F0 subunit 6 [Cerion uva]AQL10425.1 ATP synthase F0 subunit 6 [Cerion uva]
MISDLFSSLDGGYSLKYLIPVLIFPAIFLSTTWTSAMSGVLIVLPSKIWNSSSIKEYWWAQPTMVTLFVVLLTTNILGLTPWVYGYTSDLVIVSCTALVLWGTFLVSGFFASPSKFLAHLAPAGAPLAMMPFLVLIESVSILIRPLTLTVRLIANISAGHIVLGLISIPLNLMSLSMSSLALFALMVMYVLFEYFVSAIQSYIFTLLLSLYLAEHPS